jgi:predicted GNAT superfamily acetyltransferase
MIGVIDAENQSSVVFHEKFGFKTVGTIKILLLNLTVGCILFYALILEKKSDFHK